MVSKLILFLLISISQLFSQTSSKLFELYQNKQLSQLKDNLSKTSSLSMAEKQFFETLFIEDAEKAFPIYKNLFQNTDGKVKYGSAERLKEYYYAKGYYSTASDYERYLVENQSLMDEKTEIIGDIVARTPADNDLLYIQVGAFGVKDNATQMVKMLVTQNIKSKIVPRQVNSKKLFCVWIHGKPDFNDTLKYANELKQKYHFNFKIIKE